MLLLGALYFEALTARPVWRKTLSPFCVFFPFCSESSSTISSNQSQESGYQSGTIQTATFTSQNSAQGPLYEQRATQTRRYPNSISSSPQKDLTQAKVGEELRAGAAALKCCLGGSRVVFGCFRDAPELPPEPVVTFLSGVNSG